MTRRIQTVGRRRQSPASLSTFIRAQNRVAAISERDLEVLRDQYAAVNERDWARAMSHYADDARLIAGHPFVNAGTFEGADEIGRWFGDWMSQFGTDLHFELAELTELDDGRILLLADITARGRASGAPIEGHVVWSYRLRDGKITEVAGHESREQAVAPEG